MESDDKDMQFIVIIINLVSGLYKSLKSVGLALLVGSLFLGCFPIKDSPVRKRSERLPTPTQTKGNSPGPSTDSVPSPNETIPTVPAPNDKQTNVPSATLPSQPPSSPRQTPPASNPEHTNAGRDISGGCTTEEGEHVYFLTNQIYTSCEKREQPKDFIDCLVDRNGFSLSDLSDNLRAIRLSQSVFANEECISLTSLLNTVNCERDVYNQCVVPVVILESKLKNFEIEKDRYLNDALDQDQGGHSLESMLRFSLVFSEMGIQFGPKGWINTLRIGLEKIGFNNQEMRIAEELIGTAKNESRNLTKGHRSQLHLLSRTLTYQLKMPSAVIEKTLALLVYLETGRGPTRKEDTSHSRPTPLEPSKPGPIPSEKRRNPTVPQTPEPEIPSPVKKPEQSQGEIEPHPQPQPQHKEHPKDQCSDVSNSLMVKCLAGHQGLESFLNGSEVGSILLKAFTYFRFDQNYNRQMEKRIQDLSPEILFDLDSGVAEGYRIREHTSRVLGVYERQKAFYPINRDNGAAFVRNHDQFMKYVIAFHDIGKGLAVKSGNKSREELFSHTIAQGFLKQSGFNGQEVQFGVALIDLHQVIGQVFMGSKVTEEGLRETYTFSQAHREITEAAPKVGVTPDVFYRYLLLLYVADAGSYQGLYDRIFSHENGKLVPINPAYEEFQSAFMDNN